MTLAYAEEAIRIREEGNLTDALIARATGAARSTVRDWFALRSAPSGARAERVAELSALVDRLRLVMKADYIPVWLAKPIHGLDDERPIDLIGRGDYRRVSQAVAQLEDSGFS